jgi:hypothetical protein
VHLNQMMASMPDVDAGWRVSIARPRHLYGHLSAGDEYFCTCVRHLRLSEQAGHYRGAIVGAVNVGWQRGRPVCRRQLPRVSRALRFSCCLPARSICRSCGRVMDKRPASLRLLRKRLGAFGEAPSNLGGSCLCTTHLPLAIQL